MTQPFMFFSPLSGVDESPRLLSPESTLAFIASLGPAEAAILVRHRLDYRREPGYRTLREACDEAAIDPHVVLGELSLGLASEKPHAAPRSWHLRPLTALTTHIENEHHTFARAVCARIHPLLAEVSARYRKKLPRLFHLEALFEELTMQLEPRLVREVRVLFPYVNALARGHLPPLFARVESPLGTMANQHRRAAQIAAEMAIATDGFEPPPRARANIKTLYMALSELRRDLLVHIALEENVLFPRALAAEALLRKAR